MAVEVVQELHEEPLANRRRQRVQRLVDPGHALGEEDRRTKGVFARRAYQPSARRVYQPAAPPERCSAESEHLPRRAGHLSCPEALALMTHNPAAIIRKDLGTLKEDALADIAIFDEEEEWVGVPAQF